MTFDRINILLFFVTLVKVYKLQDDFQTGEIIFSIKMNRLNHFTNAQAEIIPQISSGQVNYFPNPQWAGGIISPIPNEQAELFPQFPMDRRN
jgi:hypothetical protein